MCSALTSHSKGSETGEVDLLDSSDGSDGVNCLVPCQEERLLHRDPESHIFLLKIKRLFRRVWTIFSVQTLLGSKMSEFHRSEFILIFFHVF